MRFLLQKKKRGVTLIEIIVALGIFGLLVTGSFWFISTTLRNNKIFWAQLAGQSDSRRVLERIIEDVRRAEQSSLGSYPIVSATTSSLVFYANIDDDSYRERVRYTLGTTTIERGVVKPGGNPLQYVTTTEQVLTIARNVTNYAQGEPLFYYHDESYTGVEPPLATPASSTLVRVVRIRLQVEDDPTTSPLPFTAETSVHLRNLKTN